MTSIELPPHHQAPPRLTVVRVEQGWEIRERREDNTVVFVTRHTDWHRVERSLHMLELSLVGESGS